MTRRKAKGELCGERYIGAYLLYNHLFWPMAFLRKIIGLSFHESSCVNVEEFSLIVTLCTNTVITVYNSPFKNHNFLMHTGA